MSYQLFHAQFGILRTRVNGNGQYETVGIYSDLELAQQLLEAFQKNNRFFQYHLFGRIVGVWCTPSDVQSFVDKLNEQYPPCPTPTVESEEDKRR